MDPTDGLDPPFLGEEGIVRRENPAPSGTALVPVREPQPPAPIKHEPERRKRSRRLLALLILSAAAIAGGVFWQLRRPAPLPAGIVTGNGRIEAEEIDIDTKFAGRVAERLADEGDMAAAGQVLARMDTRDLEASLRSAEAQARQAQRTLEEARANVAQQTTQVTLAQQQMERTDALVKRGYATLELLDQRRQALDGASAGLAAAKERVGEAEHALEAATHNAEVFRVNIADNTLVAPVAGRIQYRIANVGEVLPAGGRVFTLLDVSDVYMDIYLPTAQAGKAGVGADARIVLDAYPTFPVPAHVSFLATQAQFTPKAVETETERDKLMFRVKVRVDADFLKAHAAHLRTGLPGRAYVRVDPKVEWPPKLSAPTPQ